jgi:hypothetical protein
VFGREGVGGGVLSCVGDHILQEFKYIKTKKSPFKKGEV